jgi:NADH:ubiquinone oxidoreductase subunit 6 (subunit J)
MKFLLFCTFILFTAFLAFISGSYALYTIFKSREIAIAIGLVYALMIFTLDRSIVSTTRKEKGRNWQQFMNALVRILKAAFIALVITMPLETKIFQSAIARQIAEENTIAAIKAHEKFVLLLEQENQKLETELKAEQQRRDVAYKESREENEGTNGTLKTGKGPVYAEKRQEFETRNSRFMEVERRINQQITKNRQKIQKLEADKDKQYQSIRQMRIQLASLSR